MHYDMEDLLEQANEIQETLGRSYAVPDEIDEADLQAGGYSCYIRLCCSIAEMARRTGRIGA